MTGLAALALLFAPNLFPGVVVYGFLASIVVQVWSVVLGLAIWRPGPSRR